MSWTRFFRRRFWDEERARELQAHLEIETAENIAHGMAPEEARYAARRKLGNATLIREEIYRMNSLGWLETLAQDLRYGVRLLRRSPGFALVAIASLALGIGANTAIFQLLDAVRLRSLPILNPQELVEVKIAGGGTHGMGVNAAPYGQLSRPIWREIREYQQAFSGVFAWAYGEVRVGQPTELRRASAIWVSGEFFRVLGVHPWRGRLLLPEDEVGACPSSKAVVSYSYWQRHMGGGDLGGDSKLTIDGEPKEVIGVTPPEFFGLAVGDNFEIAQPFCQPKELRHDLFDVVVMGRLRPGWTIQSASAQLDALSPGIFAATAITGYPAETIETYKRFRLGVYPASTGVSWLRTKYDSSLLLLLDISALVLLMACVNLANLMMARASAREREMAVRLALGASRLRLFRQLLAECGLVAAMGAALGIAIAQLLSRVLVWALSTERASVSLRIETNWRVLLFALGVAALTCIAFGAAPALRATRTEPIAAMNVGGRGLTAGRGRFAMQRMLIVAQIAVSLVLLVGALLFVRSFRNLMTFDPGMRQAGIAIAVMRFEQSHVARDRYEEFQRQLLDEVRSVPGVLGATTTTTVPLLGGVWVMGVQIGPAEGSSAFTWVSPGYLGTMGIPLLKGRDFNQNDTGTSARVAIVNQTFVRRLLGGADPIGQTLRTHPEPNYPSTVYEIVGVIPDTKYNDLRGETPAMTFAPASQYPAQGPWAIMMIHSKAAPAITLASVRRPIAKKHSEIHLEYHVFQALIRDGLMRERLMAMLSGFFGLLAALLATVGLYGVISYVVARRRNEIGIRVALGAQRGQVVGMVMREAARLLVIGLVIGTALSLILGRTAGSLLFGLKAHDPLTLAAAGTLLTVIAALASFLPARRASTLDPMVALRLE
jgi:predicted permease